MQFQQAAPTYYNEGRDFGSRTTSFQEERMALMARLLGAGIALAAMSLATSRQQLDPKVVAFKLPIR
jgi:hypothetical protein